MVGRLGWVTDDVRDPAPTLGLEDVLNCRQLCPNDVLGHLDDTLQSFLVLSGAAGIPRCDAVTAGYSPQCTCKRSRQGSAAVWLPSASLERRGVVVPSQ